MKILSLIPLLMLVALATVFFSFESQADTVVLDTGVFIEVPSNGQFCEYHEVYCTGGWQVSESGDISFPGIDSFLSWIDGSYNNGYSDAVKVEILDFPFCDDGLVVGPGSGFPCYKLIEE